MAAPNGLQIASPGVLEVGTTVTLGSGIARTTTVRGYTPDEFSKLAAEAPKY